MQIQISGFFRSYLIWTYIVCKGRIYPGQAGSSSLYCSSSLLVHRWFHMWRFFSHGMFLNSPSFSASGRLCFVIVVFPGYLHSLFLCPYPFSKSTREFECLIYMYAKSSLSKVTYLQPISWPNGRIFIKVTLWCIKIACKQQRRLQ